ncbi:histidine kinase [Vibrio sp. qd031]|uniref:EAL and HDOD domain-containing protein n=1 Tax=Vibrio sp. qd031 TaxID=1603038 RepID=UPI000A0F98A9|nr:HDOD domain-containing protein [Vibrio sp. qd031]ORT50072.1 histidine kinase [Vibrio sp. qd031]
MTFSYVARQPILNSQRQTFGYELLYRDGPRNTFPEIEPEKATSRLLSDNFFDSNSTLLENKLAFVNFPQQSIINLVPGLFPKEQIVIEILEESEPNDQLFDAVKYLYNQGYKFALDDFQPSLRWKRFLPFVWIIKFDIRIIPVEKAQIFIDSMRGYDIHFLAEKVETYEEFEQAKQAGFELYQGYFFSRPELLQKKAIEPTFLTIVHLLKEVSKRSINYKYVESLITQDLSLSYKLLKFVNSSALISNEIKSFRQALAYLGEDRLRRFISLVAIASTNNNKPSSLYGLSLQRARFAELLAVDGQNQVDHSKAFLTGMFSVLDSLLDRPLPELLNDIPLDPDIKLALNEREGPLGTMINLIEAYEQADWETVQQISDCCGVAQPHIGECYEQSMLWSNQVKRSNKSSR